MSLSSANSGSLGLNPIVSTFVQNSSTKTSSTIVSNIQNALSPVNLVTNLSGGNFPSTSGQGQSASSRLKVEDALSYLDKVKNQFAAQPHVYNQFLDIMKEFKSQSIDTQEVINRVSTLFHGHPDLIVGFNTFLPPGYKIEVSDDNIGYIQVTHPSSRIESIAIGGNTIIHNHHPISNLLNQDQNQTNDVESSSTTQSVNVLLSAVNSPSTTKISKQQILNNNNSTNSNGQPVEFNHAINYVNKIKNRFHQNLNVYKTFLEILHTYQKQQKDAKELSTNRSNNDETIQPTLLSETEVYAKVAQLFTNHEDLLAEFSQFLPDATQQTTEHSNSISDILSSSDSSSTTINSSVSNSTPRLIINNTISSSTSVPTININSNSSSSTPTFTILSSTLDKDELSQKSTTISNKRSFPSSVKSTEKIKKQRLTINNEIDIQNSREKHQKLPSINEIEFFDKVQKTLRSSLVFDNFLRCILLYTKGIVSRIELFDLIQSYLGHAPELLKTFQELINLREPGEVIIPESIFDQNDSDNMISIDFSSCSQYGTSYRSVPRSYVPPTCTGRTQLCKEVLNDDCVLFPTFTDESSSVAAKKSVFEEHMYKIEDERFELDIVMEVNLSAIRALENVQLHMSSLTTEQLNNFQLDDQLGGQSSFTQKQAVQRIYGERANEIIDGLKRNPRVAVPIVLKRLKSKDEEWRESKKNFERFWKEQSEKYYLKSLDYMGINCKNIDGRIIRNRHLLNEIENIKEERDQQLKINNHQPHLIFRYEDFSVFDDAASLIIYLVKRQTTFAKEDKQNIKKLIYQFLPDFLFAPRGELTDDDEDFDDDLDNENNPKRDKKSRPTRFSDGNRRRNTENSTNKWRQLPQEYQISHDIFHIFFTNDNYYYFFRLHQLLCERLLKMFQQSLRLIEQENNSQRNRNSSGIRYSTRVDEYYSLFLDMIRNLLDGNLDSTSYEDSLREMFGIHAYVAFTMDKIIHNCVRQLHAIVTDESFNAINRSYSSANATISLVENFYSMTQQNAEVAYQREVETYVDGNRLFRICSFKNDRRVTISLISIDSSSDNEDDEEKQTENGTNYVEKYLHNNNHDETITIHLKTKLRLKPRFLLRNLRILNQQSIPEVITMNNDYCCIDSKTLKRKPFHRAGFFFYKRGSFHSTKQNHKRFALKQYNRFTKFYQDWSSKHLNDNEDNSLNNLWLKTHRFNNNNNEQQNLIIQSIYSNDERDLSQPPYHHCYKNEILHKED